jgi:hypothetical protein
MDPAAPPLFCAQAEEATVYGRPLSAELGCTRAAGMVGGLPMPGLVESLTTSCCEGGDGSGVVQRPGIVQSH